MIIIDREKEYNIENLYFFLVQEINNPYRIQRSKVYYYSQNNVDLDVSSIINLNQTIEHNRNKYNVLYVGNNNPIGLCLKNERFQLNNKEDFLNFLRNSTQLIDNSSEELNVPNWFYLTDETISQKNNNFFDYLYSKYKCNKNNNIKIENTDPIENVISAIEIVNDFDFETNDLCMLKSYFSKMYLPIVLEEKGIEPEKTFLSEYDLDNNKYYFNIKIEELETLNIKKPDFLNKKNKP